MKKVYLLGGGLILLTALYLGLRTSESHSGKYAELRQKLKDHPFAQRERHNGHRDAGEEEGEGEKGPAAPDRAWEQDYLRTMDPALGRPTPEALIPVMTSMRAQAGIDLAPGAPQAPWVERGPNNVGGRTRALVWDPNDVNGKKVWAGGVNGGVWYNNDITSAASSWVNVNDFWDNIAVTCIAFDPVDPSIMYAGTGEGFTANGTSSARGAGIWKSSNGGNTWTQLISTSAFYWVNDIVVRDEGGSFGVVYAAISGQYHAGEWHGNGAQGVHRSADGGSSFINVSPDIPGQSNKLVAADLEIGANNRIWAGSKANSYSGSDRGGGRIFYSDNGNNWTVSHSVSVTNGKGRVAIACAPSDSNTVYALVESDNQLTAIVKTTDYGANWSGVNEPSDADNGIPNTDFTRGQAWYDLVVAVDPNNPNVLIAGGVDLFRSTNGGSSWSQISKWSNNNNLGSLSCSEVHADQHAILFKPGSSSTVIFGNDGGVFYSSSISTSASNDVIFMRNKDYNITQFYSCAIHPGSGSNIFLAGSQDNGTQRFSSAGPNSTTEVTGGDGAFCFIDQDDPNIAISSYVYNRYYRSTNSGQTFPIDLMDDANTGKFINVADYHDADNVLYSGKGSGSIWRVRNITSTPSSPETITVSGMSDDASAIRCSPYSSTVFVGSDVGTLFRITSANGSYNVTEITGGSMPAGSVSCIEIGADDDELLVTFFNYGVVSVWYTSNGGSNWTNKEGNLPNMPVRWALFNPNNRDEVILATDLGVWSTNNLNSSSPSWNSSSSGLANTRVDMLQLRDSDQMVIAATHGRGLFSSNAFAAQAPDAEFGASALTTCVPVGIRFYDSSVHDPNEWKWSFTPNTVTYVNGTGDTSQNPEVRFNAAGTYTVSLTASNALGSDIRTRSTYITVTAATVPTIVITPDANPTCIGSSVNFSAVVTDEGSSPVYDWKVNGVSTGSTGASFSSTGLSDGDTVTCTLLSSETCAVGTPEISNAVIMTLYTVPSVSLVLTTENTCITENPFALGGGMPAGGTYSGKSVSNNTFDPVLAGFGSHTITYTYTDPNGCSASVTDVINVGDMPNKPTISRTGDKLTCSVIAAFYEWKVDGVVIPSAINRDLTMTKSATYEVKITNGFGCSNTSDPLEAFMTSVNGVEGVESALIYPNPNSGTFTLRLNTTREMLVEIRIVDLQGKELMLRNVKLGSGESEQHFRENLSPGTYILVIHGDGQEEQVRFTVE